MATTPRIISTRFDAARGDVEAPIVNGAVAPSSDATALLCESHTVASRAVLLDSAMREGYELDLISGSVTIDSGSTVRRSGSLTVLDSWSDDLRAPLASTAGSRIKVQRGVRLPSGAIEWMTLGTLRLVEDSMSEEGRRGKITLGLKDEVASVARDRFDLATSTDTTMTVAAQITTWLRRTVPGAEVIDLTGAAGQTLCGKLDVQQDPAGGIAKLATSIGAVLYAGAGPAQFVLAPVATLADTPRWELSVGEHGNLISVGRKRSADKTYNRVFAKGETTSASTSSTTPPATGEAVISDPLDPLVYGGKFGKVTRFYTSPLLKTNEQATAAAQGMLERVRGAEVEFTFTSLVNPALGSDHVIWSTLSDGRRRTHIVDSVTHPLGVGENQSVTGRTAELPDEQAQSDSSAASMAVS